MPEVKVITASAAPITEIGVAAAICYGKKTGPDTAEADYKRGLHCIESGHGRPMEFADITLEINGYSARVIRELYTHIIGVSRLQESTRYVNMENFECYIPEKVTTNPDAFEQWCVAEDKIRDIYTKLVNEYDIPKEDAAGLLPINYRSRMLLKINVRGLLHLANERCCTRAYHEFQSLMEDIIATVTNYCKETGNLEWAYIGARMVPKCKDLGYCPESKGCGLMLSKKEVLKGD